MYAAVVIFVVPAVLISAFIWRGYVLSVIWGWVMVSHFGAPGMSIPVAIAVSTMVSMLTTSKAGNELEDEKKWYAPLAKVFLMPLLTLFVVWAALKFA